MAVPVPGHRHREVFTALQHALGVDLDDEEDRYRHRETVAAILRGWFAARDLATVSAELKAARVLWGPYRTPLGVVRDHEALPASSLLSEVDQPGVGRLLAMGSPVRVDGGTAAPVPAPVLGADTDAVLADVLGLGSTEIGRLHDDGVVASAGAGPCQDGHPR